ncbi:MAG: aldo/keto reductase, partial [Gaiellaceae bacterium]
MIDLPRTGLGTAPLGGLFEAVSDETAQATFELAWERGIRFFDTAPLYGLGLSEQRLGRFLAGRPRDEFVLASKVGRLLRADAPPDPRESHWAGTPPLNPVFDFGYDGVLRSVDESLERLGLDRIDVVHIHDPDDHYEEALAGAYRALDRLRGEGTIRAVGAGMNQVEMLVAFAREVDFDCFLVAGRWTLLDRSALTELLPLCEERGIAVIAAGVFNSGILAGGTTFDYRPAAPGLL